MKRLLLGFLFLLFFVPIKSQTRYLDEVFASVTVSSNVIYGNNLSVLTGVPTAEDLLMDIYEPTGDIATDRPLILYLSGFKFLPRYVNQYPTGSKSDSATVEICTRLAKQGYVVAAVDYRKGWSPSSAINSYRTETFVRAVYRGLQDAKTCVRYFRKDVATNNNSFGIDDTKIAVGGQGSGGYISLAYGSLDKLSEIQLQKFYNNETSAYMVDTTLWGNWSGIGGNPAYNTSNHVGYSDNVSMVFNIGGAVGDSTWIEAGEIPIVTMQGEADYFAPFQYGIVTVPGTTVFVIDVSGSSDISRMANAFGNNDVFKTPAITDVYTTRANAFNTANDATYGNAGDEGLFAFEGAANGNGPWEWIDTAAVKAEAAAWGQDGDVILDNFYASNPLFQYYYETAGYGAARTRAIAYCDTIQGYLSPRLFRGLFCFDSSTTLINDVFCGSYNLNGQVYNAPGTYSQTLTNGSGCDSIITLSLNLDSTSNTINDVFCGSYILNGQTYTSPGTYTQTLTNVAGCDSVITLNLSYNSSSSTMTQIACGSYTLNGQTYTSSGTFTQTLTNAVGCDSTINLVLTILSSYPLAFQANPTAGTTPLNVIFDNQTPNLSNYNFTWSFGDGTVVQDNGSFVSHTYQSDGTWDVMLIAEDITTGCTDTLFNNGYIFSTGGTPCGHVAAITQSGPITACLSDSIFLSCNTDPNFTYQWQLNGFPISGATDQTYYPAQSGSYMVVITDNNCPVFSSTIQVTINTFTAPTISGAGSISSCSGGSMTLSVPDDYVSYLWSSGGTDTSEVVTSSGDYTVTVINVSGCQATSSIYSINASLIPTQEICIVTVDSTSDHNLVVWEKPIVAGIDSFIVYREMGTNNYMPIGSVAYDSLSQFLDTTNGINPNVTSYRYKVSILDTCGTESNLSYYHETMHLSTNQGIGGEVNLIWDEYEGFPIVYYYILRDSTANGNWEVLDSVSSNNFIYTDLNPPVSGVNYVIEVLPPNTCTSTKAQDHNSTRSNRASIVGGGGQGIFQHPTNNVNVYPNPTSDQITVDIKGYNGVVNVAVYDLQGRLLETTTNTIVSLKKHAKGIYVLKISYGEVTEEVRVVRD